jgi:hypothetical protein
MLKPPDRRTRSAGGRPSRGARFAAAGRIPRSAMHATVLTTIVVVGMSACGGALQQRASPSVTFRSAHATLAPFSRRAERTLIDRLGSAKQSIRPQANGLLQFHDVQYHASFGDTETPSSFTAFVTVDRQFAVSPSSAALITERGRGRARFLSPADERHWRKDGAPHLDAGLRSLDLPPGAFGFAPQGLPLTYADAISLPATPAAIQHLIVSLLRWPAGSTPPASLILRQYGFILGTAPLAHRTRAAIAAAVAALPGAHICGRGRDLVGRRGIGVCVDDGYDDIQVLVDARSGAVLAVSQRIPHTSPMYPGLRGGALVQEDVFGT